jgi:hypothetical protein
MISFKDFVFREQRVLFWLGAGLFLLQFILLKWLYPHAMFSYDSYDYIAAAMTNADIDIRPTGYSKLLRLLHFLGHSDLVVVLFQYLLLQGSVFFFYFTLLYFMRPTKWLRWILFLAFTLNTMAPIISNYIMSDGVFTAFTVLWFTFTLWCVFRPRAIFFYVCTILLVILFLLRYYAIFYPIITLFVTLFARIGWKTKIYSVGLGCFLFLGYTWHIGNQYYKVLGRREFSPFAGWQLASNALLMYRNLPQDFQEIPPLRLQPLHRFVTHHLDSVGLLDLIPRGFLSIYFLSDEGPLKRFMKDRYQDDHITGKFAKWASMGDLYKDYALYLIKKHPLAYARYCMTDGLEWFVQPTVEFTNLFPNGQYHIYDDARKWFHYEGLELRCTTKTIYSVWPYWYIILIMNILMFLSLAGFLFCRCYRYTSSDTNKAIGLGVGYWLLSLFFMSISAPMVVRYAIPIMILSAAFILLQLEWIWKSASLQDDLVAKRKAALAAE